MPRFKSLFVNLTPCSFQALAVVMDSIFFIMPHCWQPNRQGKQNNHSHTHMHSRTQTHLSDRQHQLHWVGQSAGRQLSGLWAELLSLYSQEEPGPRRKGGNLHESGFPTHPQQQIVNKISHPKPKRKRFGPFLLGHREGFYSCFPVAPGTQTPCHLASLLSAPSPSPARFTLGSVFKASGQKGLLNFISCRGVSVPDSAKTLRPE